MKRRDFLKAGLIGALALWGLKNMGEAQAAGAAPAGVTLPQGRKVDIHAHAILPSFVRGLEKLGIDPVAQVVGGGASCLYGGGGS